jgi:hypothetical protein
VGFINFVVIPLLELTFKALKNMDEEFINPVRQSLGYYKNLFEEQKIKD